MIKSLLISQSSCWYYCETFFRKNIFINFFISFISNIINIIIIILDILELDFSFSISSGSLLEGLISIVWLLSSSLLLSSSYVTLLLTGVTSVSLASSLITLIVYIFTSPFSAVTVILTILFPTANSTGYSITLTAPTFDSSVSTFNSVTSFGTLIEYSNTFSSNNISS